MSLRVARVVLAMALCLGCSGRAPIPAEEVTSTRIEGRPLLVLTIANPMADTDQRICDGIERWVLYDDGHVVFCNVETRGSEPKDQPYRIAMLGKAEMDELRANLPYTAFFSEEDKDLEPGAMDMTGFELKLRWNDRWRAHSVVGRMPNRPPGLVGAMVGWVLDKGGALLKPPPAFASVYWTLRSISLDRAVPYVPDQIAVTLSAISRPTPTTFPWPATWPVPTRAAGESSDTFTATVPGADLMALSQLAGSEPFGGKIVELKGQSYGISYYQVLLPGEAEWSK